MKTLVISILTKVWHGRQVEESRVKIKVNFENMGPFSFVIEPMGIPSIAVGEALSRPPYNWPVAVRAACICAANVGLHPMPSPDLRVIFLDMGTVEVKRRKNLH